jgi:hypothetical protein
VSEIEGLIYSFELGFLSNFPAIKLVTNKIGMAMYMGNFEPLSHSSLIWFAKAIQPYTFININHGITKVLMPAILNVLL